MRFEELGDVRSAMYGYDFAGAQKPGWFDHLFQDYSLHPYLNIVSDDTQDLLYKKSLFGKLMPVFAKHLRISSVINEMVGLDFLKQPDKGPGVIQDIAEILVQEVESAQTLGSRVAKKIKKLRGTRRHFAGIAEPTQGFSALPELKRRDPATDGGLIALTGVLSRRDSIDTFNDALADSLPKKPLSWVVTDLPPFQMVPGAPGYNGEVVALRIPEAITEVLSRSAPFAPDFDWYPYVQVFGRFHESFDAQNLGLKVIDFSWLRIRRPRPFDDSIADSLAQVAKAKKTPVYSHVDLDDPASALLFLSAIQICLVANNVRYDLAKDRFGDLVQAAARNAGDKLPQAMRTVFGM